MRCLYLCECVCLLAKTIFLELRFVNIYTINFKNNKIKNNKKRKCKIFNAKHGVLYRVSTLEIGEVQIKDVS